MTSEQLDLLDLIAEIESYVEPCPECARGRCNMCDRVTVDHAVDRPSPCPCGAQGHLEVAA